MVGWIRNITTDQNRSYKLRGLGSDNIADIKEHTQ